MDREIERRRNELERLDLLRRMTQMEVELRSEQLRRQETETALERTRADLLLLEQGSKAKLFDPPASSGNSDSLAISRIWNMHLTIQVDSKQYNHR